MTDAPDMLQVIGSYIKRQQVFKTCRLDMQRIRKSTANKSIIISMLSKVDLEHSATILKRRK